MVPLWCKWLWSLGRRSFLELTTLVNLLTSTKYERRNNCFFQYDLEASTHDFQKKHYSRAHFFCVGTFSTSKSSGILVELPIRTSRNSESFLVPCCCRWCSWRVMRTVPKWCIKLCSMHHKRQRVIVVDSRVAVCEVCWGWLICKKGVNQEGPPSKRVTEIGIVETSCNSRWVTNPNSESRILEGHRGSCFGTIFTTDGPWSP